MIPKNKKQATLADALIPISFLALFLCVSIFKYGTSPHIPLIGGAIVAGLVAIFKLNYSWNEIEESMFSSIKMAMQAILIIMIIGVLIGTWIISGIVPAMIYWGLDILSPSIFLVATTLICAIISISTGSSWTTMGTVGVALLAIGQGLNIPSTLVCGAIISGSYFGDKLSSLSETTNLSPAMAGCDIFDHIKFMLYSTIPTLIICLIIYSIMGIKYSGQEVDLSQINLIRTTLESSYNTLSPILFIPPIIVITLVIFKVPAIPGLLCGVVLGAIFAVLFQDASIGDIINAAHSGFISNTGVASVDELLSKGGLMSMMSTISLTICALSLGGILEKTGMLQVIASSILRFAKGTFGVVFATMFTCIMTNVVAGEQYLSIVIPGSMFKKEYIRRGLHPKMLSRALEDSGTLTSALIPWNTCGAYIYGTLGISAFEYFPYAFLNLLNPIISLLLISIGFNIAKLSKNEINELINKEVALSE